MSHSSELASPSPAELAMAQWARSVSLSKFCADEDLFSAWLRSQNVGQDILTGSPPELRDVGESGKFDITIVNSRIPTMINTRMSQLRTELAEMFTFEDAPGQPSHDEFGICDNADLLCSSYIEFRSVKGNSSETHLRRPIDDVVKRVFQYDGNLHFETELPMLLPSIKPALRAALGLSNQSTVYMDSGVCSWAKCDVKDEAHSLSVELGVQLNAVKMRTIPHDYDRTARIAIPDLLCEYNMNDTATLLNQTTLDIVITLRHREYLDLKSRPVRGFALVFKTLYFFLGKWEADVLFVHSWETALPLLSLKAWVRFYLMLVRIRNSLLPIPSIKVDEALRRPAWRPTTSKRDLNMTPSSPRPTKRQKMTFPSDSDSDSVVGGSRVEEDATGTLIAENVSQLRSPVPVHARVQEFILGLGLTDSFEQIDHPDRTEDKQETFSNAA